MAQLELGLPGLDLNCKVQPNSGGWAVTDGSSYHLSLGSSRALTPGSPVWMDTAEWNRAGLDRFAHWNVGGGQLPHIPGLSMGLGALSWNAAMVLFPRQAFCADGNGGIRLP